MSDPEVRLAKIRKRRAAMPDGPLDVDVDRNEEEYYMRWAMVRYGPPDKYGERDWIAATNAENQGVAEFIAHAPEDIDHLLSEVERLRDHLREIEFAGGTFGDNRWCPACQAARGHAVDCWLARELRST